jgi:hypothetical protein
MPQPTRLPAIARSEYADIQRRMQAAFPAEAARIGRALGVLFTREILETAELGVYLVQTASDPTRYYRTTSLRCTCPDGKRPGVVCKHSHSITILSVASAVASYQRAVELARYRASGVAS